MTDKQRIKELERCLELTNEILSKGVEHQDEYNFWFIAIDDAELDKLHRLIRRITRALGKEKR